MPPLKLWSGDHTVKKIGNASTLSEVVKQAQEKGVCTSENAKVFLRDWTEVEEDFFQEVIEHLLLEETIFIVTDTAPTTEPTLQGHSGTQNMSSSNPEGETAALQAISEEKTALCASALANFLRDSNKKEVLYYYVQMELEESRGNRGAKEAAFLPLLAALFKDDVGQLFRVFEEGTSITERLHELPCTPTVVALGSFFQNQCYIICEQQVLFSEPTGFGEATRLAFLAYYVFNMSYTVKAATTLEFLQREIFDINPTKGTKWNGKQKCRTIVHAKIMKLVFTLRARTLSAYAQ
ncbi:uncharacterized protein LOC144124590 isoform X2 [Amblyomma americanum]